MNYEDYAAIIEKITPAKAGTQEWKTFWKKNIDLSQQVTHYEVEGKEYPRIPYGNEDNHLPFDIFMQRTSEGVLSYATIAKEHPCHDCNVVQGQLHVPGCDTEKCPRCFSQAISCDCDDSEEEGEA